MGFRFPCGPWNNVRSEEPVKHILAEFGTQQAYASPGSTPLIQSPRLEVALLTKLHRCIVRHHASVALMLIDYLLVSYNLKRPLVAALYFVEHWNTRIPKDLHLAAWDAHHVLGASFSAYSVLAEEYFHRQDRHEPALPQLLGSHAVQASDLYVVLSAVRIHAGVQD